METKKISFGFMKTKKQEKPGTVEKREYIECVEEKSIKVIGGEAVKEIAPLVIPMKPNSLVTAERLKEIALKVESALEEPEPTVKNEKPVEEVPENETLEQMAARELLQEAKKQKEIEQPILSVPIPAKPVLNGERESTLDDYESVPIQEFGLAMLRGMGWTPNQEQSKYKQPQLRPKGLGLGADKVVKDSQKKKTSKEKDEELSIVKGACVKVTVGKYNGYYGKVVSLDEDNGRVMIHITVKKETVSLSEFMMQAVTKSEFDKQSKVLNADTYSEYKKNESMNQKMVKQQNPTSTRESSSSHRSNEVSNRDRERRQEDRYKEFRNDDNHSNGKSKDKVRHIRSRSNSRSDEEVLDRRDQRNRREYSSSESLDSDSDRKHRRRKKRQGSSSDSGEDKRRHKSKSSKSSKEKRDIDKKRKGKKKKRDRDRSPNYRKHKKS